MEVKRKPIFGGNFKAGQERDTKKNKEEIDITFEFLRSYFKRNLFDSENIE